MVLRIPPGISPVAGVTRRLSVSAAKAFRSMTSDMACRSSSLARLCAIWFTSSVIT